VSVIYLVLPLALLIAAGMIWAFMRSVRRGQFDDLDTPALRMLFDDHPARRDKAGQAGDPPTKAADEAEPPSA
jgi:cbb3-type cytochrome oxidase maturation protein